MLVRKYFPGEEFESDEKDLGMLRMQSSNSFCIWTVHSFNSVFWAQSFNCQIQSHSRINSCTVIYTLIPFLLGFALPRKHHMESHCLLCRTLLLQATSTHHDGESFLFPTSNLFIHNIIWYVIFCRQCIQRQRNPTRDEVSGSNGSLLSQGPFWTSHR